MKTAKKHSVNTLIFGIAFNFFMISCGTFSEIERDIDRAAAVRYAKTGDLEAEIDRLSEPLIEEGRTPGVVVGVLLPDGSKKTFGYGVTCAQNGRTPDGDTLFAIGSAGKSFTGSVAAKMVLDGDLNWETQLKDVLGDEMELSPDAEKITLLQLATHSSGLSRQPMGLRTPLFFIQYLFTGKNFYRHFDRDYIYNYMRRFRSPLFRDPRYSNTGYAVLGRTLEVYSGMSLDDLVSGKLIDPLGLSATGYDPAVLPGYDERALAHAGDHPKLISRGRPVPEWSFTKIMRGAAGLYSTADDLLDYLAAHMSTDEEEPLFKALADTMNPRLDFDEISRAIAWAVEEIDGHMIVYQVGFVSGYSCYIGMNPENGTGVVVLQNSLNWRESIGHRLLLLMAAAGVGLCQGGKSGN